VRTPEVWQFEIDKRHPDEVWRLHNFIIKNEQTGEDVGYVLLRAPKEFKYLGIMSYVVGEKSSYLETFDDVMRGIKAFVVDYYRDLPAMMPDAIYFDSGAPEAVDLMIQATPGGRMLPDTYAWYLRVPDYALFFRQIAPALEHRLRGSGANGYTGTFKVGFADLTGIEMTFAGGKLVDVVQRGFDLHEGDVRFPFHTFLNVVFGHHTQAELYHILPDSFANAKARVLLAALFPRQRSAIYPLG